MNLNKEELKIWKSRFKIDDYKLWTRRFEILDFHPFLLKLLSLQSFSKNANF